MPANSGWWWQAPGGGISTVPSCPHGSYGAYCHQCQNPALFSPSSPFYTTYQLGGWKCPGCGRCWSPAVTQCAPCAPPAAAAGSVSPEPFSDLCQPSAEGGMCGCDDSEDQPSACMGGRHCSC
jgi:hypothetical protein